MKDPLEPYPGYAELLGYELQHWREDHAEIVLHIGGRHLNRSGVVHGGVLMSLMDTAAGYAGCWSADPSQPKLAVTVSLSASFLAPARAGRLVTVGRRVGGGRSIYFADARVVDDHGATIARAEGVFRYRRSASIPRARAPEFDEL